MIPGEIHHAEGQVPLNEGADVIRLTVLNTADRPVQIGSHYHFAEANPGLGFDRAAAHGRRLAVPAGTAVRFEPGIPVEVALVPLRGRRVVAGLRGETAGPLDAVAATDTEGTVPEGTVAEETHAEETPRAGRRPRHNVRSQR